MPCRERKWPSNWSLMQKRLNQLESMTNATINSAVSKRTFWRVRSKTAPSSFHRQPYTAARRIRTPGGFGYTIARHGRWGGPTKGGSPYLSRASHLFGRQIRSTLTSVTSWCRDYYSPYGFVTPNYTKDVAKAA